MTRSNLIDLTLIAITLYILCCVPSLIGWYRDDEFKGAVEAPFRHASAEQESKNKAIQEFLNRRDGKVVGNEV